MMMMMMMMLTMMIQMVYSYKPVIMMHGVGSDHGEMNTIEKILLERDNTTLVTSLHLYEGQPASWDASLPKQVEGVINAVKSIVAENSEAYKDGYHFVCKSQGALTCRVVLEAFDEHDVKNFVSLAGPQSGVYGSAYFESISIYLNGWLEQLLKKFT